MENAWIEHLNSPLVLIGFMLFVFAGVIKLLLQNNVIRVNQANLAKLISKSLNFIFVLALVGMILGFFSQEKVLETVKNPAIKSMVNNSMPVNAIEKTQIENLKNVGNTIQGSTISGSTVIQTTSEKQDK